MIINRAVYDLILCKISNNHGETGGIIGGQDDVVTEFEFDMGTDLSSRDHYYPATDKLNACIDRWQDNNIQFYGIVHSHLLDAPKLSLGDEKYIHAIMKVMPVCINYLYFPIVVVPSKRIVSYKAVRNGGIDIIRDDVKII